MVSSEGVLVGIEGGERDVHIGEEEGARDVLAALGAPGAEGDGWTVKPRCRRRAVRWAFT
jgi:hypothetical protein